MKDLKTAYNNVLAQTMSTSGIYLFAGNRFGDIFVQDVRDFDKTEEPPTEVKIFPQPPRTEVNSLCFKRDFLVVGAIGVIYGLKWDEEACELSRERAWEINIPLDIDAIEVPDVNYMWLRPDTDMLYAGCGDNMVYQIDLEDGRIVRKYSGHTDYIHGVTGFADGRIFTASEDGTVRFWTHQQKDSVNLIEPNKQSQLVRCEFGKWIGAIDVNDEWLVCGGGPKASIWHIGSLELMRDIPYEGKIHVCHIIDDSIVIGGEYKQVNLYTLNGEPLAQIPVEHTATYSILWQMQPTKFMSVAGFSNKLHILRDFRFLDSSIDLYKKPEIDDFCNSFD